MKSRSLSGLSGFFLFGALGLAMLAGCNRADHQQQGQPTVTSADLGDKGTPPAPPPPGGGRVVTIVTNTQATLDDVRIGAGNFRDEQADGKTRRSCALWISVRDKPAEDRTLPVHTGVTFDASSQHFEVRNVDDNSVELVVRPK